MYSKIKIIATITVIVVFTFTGCKNDNSLNAPIGGSPSSKLAMKIHAYNPTMLGSEVVKIKTVGNQTYVQFPITGGTLDVQSAMLNFKDLVIEENSGFDGEQQGENNSGEQNDGGSELETPDITSAGPFVIDLSNGNALIGSFDVYPGTFKKVNFSLSPNSAEPFLGQTIVISGTYTQDGGTIIPFTLKSDIIAQLQLPLANGGVVVSANSTVSISIIVDLPSLFNSVNFTSATSTNGEISIDSQNNSALLSRFETNLNTYIDAEDGSDDNG